MIDRDQLVQSVNSADQTIMPTIAKDLITKFGSMEDKNVHDTLLFIQSQVEAQNISESPFHALMTELGNDDALFERMSAFVQAKQPEPTADDN